MPVRLALAQIIFDTIEFTDDDRKTMELILNSIDRSINFTIEKEDAYKEIVEKFKKALVDIENRGPTAKLWIQYFRMSTLIKLLVEAERMGCWQLHLDTIQKMLPYLHASGHFFYARYCHLYLQDMYNLEKKMDSEEYDNFTEKGFFTIKRSPKFFCGTPTDMTIEQNLMRSMKSLGGLTRARGLTDSVLTLWSLGMVYLHNVCDDVEKFTGVALGTTEQHVDMRSARIIRDDEDLKKLSEWLSSHFPFPRIEELMSIGTGIVGTEKTVTCLMKWVFLGLQK